MYILRHAGYWLADQPYNRARRPEGLAVYELAGPNRIHGHIGHMGGHNDNALELLMPTLESLNPFRGFGFVRDYVEITK